jgi:hypothetical protein
MPPHVVAQGVFGCKGALFDEARKPGALGAV